MLQSINIWLNQLFSQCLGLRLILHYTWAKIQNNITYICLHAWFCAFVRWHNSDVCSTSNNYPLWWSNKAQLVHCVLTVEKTWLTTFLSTIKTASYLFLFQGRVLDFKLLLSDVYLSHIDHKQRRWHNNHLSIVQYSAGKNLDAGF